MLPQDKLAELKETAAKLCAPGRVKTCETLDSIDIAMQLKFSPEKDQQKGQLC